MDAKYPLKRGLKNKGTLFAHDKNKDFKIREPHLFMTTFFENKNKGTLFANDKMRN